MIESCKKYFKILKENKRNKYFSYLRIFSNFIENYSIKYNLLYKDDILYRKKSDTLFILGSGSSLNKLSKIEIDTIKKNDLFGLNFSYLKSDIIPTFHQFSWEKSYACEYLTKFFYGFRNKYKNTVIFISDKARYRFAHPKLTPDFFPVNPSLYYYDLPKAINVDKNGFSDELFDQSIFYRGTLSLILELIISFEYKKIVLIGVDLDTREHFFDNMDIMQEYCAIFYEKNTKEKFESMYIKKNKEQTFDKYLIALEDYLRRKKGIQLYTAFQNKMLSPKLPTYFKEHEKNI